MTCWQSESEETVWAGLEVMDGFLDIAGCPLTDFVIRVQYYQPHLNTHTETHMWQQVGTDSSLYLKIYLQYICHHVSGSRQKLHQWTADTKRVL